MTNIDQGRPYFIRLRGVVIDESASAAVRSIHQLLTFDATFPILVSCHDGSAATPWVFVRTNIEKPVWLIPSPEGDGNVSG